MKKTINKKDYLIAAGIVEDDSKNGDKKFETAFETAVNETYGKKKNSATAQSDKTAAATGKTVALSDSGEKTDAKSKLQSELDDMTNEYEKLTERTFDGVKIKDYEPKVFDGKTDEEIKEEAEGKYNPSAEREKGDLKRKSQKKIVDLNEKIGDAETEKNQKIEKLDSDYADDYEVMKNSAVKRGLGRSSIFDGEAEGLAEKLSDDKQSAAADAEAEKRKIRRDISDVKDELYYAIKNLDDETAEKIKAEVEKLTEKRDKEKAAVDEYNRVQKEKHDEQIKESEANGVKYDEKLTEEYAAYYAGKFKKLFKFYKGFGSRGAEEVKKDRDFIVKNLDEAGYENLLNYMR